MGKITVPIQGDKKIKRAFMWASVIGTLIAVPVFVWMLYISVQVNKYIDHWFAENISYSGMRSSGFGGFRIHLGSLQVKFNGIVTLENGRIYKDVYVYTIFPAKGDRYGAITMLPEK